MPMSPAARRRLMGTSANEQAPWETYDAEMDPLAGCPEHLRAEVAEYSQRRHGRTSSKNVEELCRQKELSVSAAKEFRFENQDEISSEGPDRVGRIMNCFEFVDKISTIIPAYLSATVRKGLSGLAVLQHSQWKYVCAVQVGNMHEYSTVYVDAHGAPLNEKWRGWRTVLLRLIIGGFVTEQQAIETFGEPSGPAARRYREQLYYFRNRKGS